jgi:hypothetical protein
VVAILTIFVFAGAMSETIVVIDDPWADSVLEFTQGSNPVSGPYSDASKAVGPSPEAACMPPTTILWCAQAARAGGLCWDSIPL